MSEWISVNDRLPDDHGIFIIVTESGFIGICSYSTDTGFAWKGSEITHWIPLPEPPRASDE